MATRTAPAIRKGSHKFSEPFPASADSVSEPALIQRERAVLRDLVRLVAERAAVEPRIDAEFQKETEAVDEDFEIGYQDIIVRFATDKENAERAIHEARQELTRRFQAERAAADKEFADARKKIIGRYDGDKHHTKTELQETRWTITAVLDSNKRAAETQLQEARRGLADSVHRVRGIEQKLKDYLKACRQSTEDSADPSAPVLPRMKGQPLDQLQECVAMAGEQFAELTDLRIPKLLKGEKLFGSSVVLYLLALG